MHPIEALLKIVLIINWIGPATRRQASERIKMSFLLNIFKSVSMVKVKGNGLSY